MSVVGVYAHEKRARQLIRFDGMNIGKRSFTDFDAVAEWRNHGWLVFEVKYEDKGVPDGQRIALERFVFDASACGKYAVAAIVEHHVSDPADDVYLRDCIVRDVFVTGEYRWRTTTKFMNAHGLFREFVDVVDRRINKYGYRNSYWFGRA